MQSSSHLHPLIARDWGNIIWNYRINFWAISSDLIDSLSSEDGKGKKYLKHVKFKKQGTAFRSIPPLFCCQVTVGHTWGKQPAREACLRLDPELEIKWRGIQFLETDTYYIYIYVFICNIISIYTYSLYYIYIVKLYIYDNIYICTIYIYI